MGYQSEFHVCDTWLVQVKVGCILQQGCMTCHTNLSKLLCSIMRTSYISAHFCFLIQQLNLLS